MPANDTKQQHCPLAQRYMQRKLLDWHFDLVVLVGTKKALGMAIRRADARQRYTALRRRLQTGDSIPQFSFTKLGK